MMKMNFFKVLFFFVCTFVIISTNAQEPIKADKRLYDIKSAEYIAQTEQYAPVKILEYNYYLNHSYRIEDTMPENAMDYGSIYSMKGDIPPGVFNEPLEVFENNTFNALQYRINRYPDRSTCYDLGNGKYLVFYSIEEYKANKEAYFASLGY